MEKEILVTGDGSHTIVIPAMEVTYHSRHGAIQESVHVFIETGLRYRMAQLSDGVQPSQAQAIRILEMGFGTGLNALLTLQYAIQHSLPVYYQSLELYPLATAEVAQLNYTAQLNEPGLESMFREMHTCTWEADNHIHPLFTLHKKNQSLLNLPIEAELVPSVPSADFDLIYYDAFAPRAQPELWTEDTFRRLFTTLRPGGILVTYCSKSIVRRAMQAAGFTVTKPPGPWGKREMLRAVKPCV